MRAPSINIKIPTAGNPTSADATLLSKYRGNDANTMGVVMNRWAVGTVQFMDISLETDREIRTQGTFMVGKLAAATVRYASSARSNSLTLTDYH